MNSGIAANHVGHITHHSTGYTRLIHCHENSIAGWHFTFLSERTRFTVGALFATVSVRTEFLVDSLSSQDTASLAWLFSGQFDDKAPRGYESPGQHRYQSFQELMAQRGILLALLP